MKNIPGYTAERSLSPAQGTYAVPVSPLPASAPVVPALPCCSVCKGYPLPFYCRSGCSPSC